MITCNRTQGGLKHDFFLLLKNIQWSIWDLSGWALEGLLVVFLYSATSIFGARLSSWPYCVVKFLWTSIGSWALEYRVDGIYRMKFTGSVEWDSNNSNLPIYMEFLDEIWIYPIYRSCPRFLSHRQLSRQSPVAAIVAPCLAVPGLGSDLSHVWHSLRMWLKAWGGHAMILFLLGICSDNIYIYMYLRPGCKDVAEVFSL